MYAEEDEPENINDYINGTDNPSLNEEADDQQSFLLPTITQENTDLVLFQDDD